VAKRVAGLVIAVPRFSNVAFGSVLLLIGSGVGATIIHLPTLASLWQTSYGKALLVKIGLLLAALLLASGNLLRTKPRLAIAQGDPEVGASTARLLRRLVSGELVLVTGAIVAAAVLTSLPPPPKSLASVGSIAEHVGPGPVSTTVEKSGYQFAFRISPNKAAVTNDFRVAITRNGKPVHGADVLLEFDMLDMEMPSQEYRLSETSPGVYAQTKPALVMVGHWGLAFTLTVNGKPVSLTLEDHATG
jgi:copper transport protein